MKAVLCVPMVVALLGCASEPIENIAGTPIVAPQGKRLSRNDVAAAIQRAGKALGWTMTAEAPGLMSARLVRRSHVAVVEIEYDAASYSIRYRDSANLDASHGRIHEAYNEWVRKLDEAVRAELETP